MNKHLPAWLALMTVLAAGNTTYVMADHAPEPPGKPFVKGPFETFLVMPCRVFDTRKVPRLSPNRLPSKIRPGVEFHVKVRNQPNRQPTDFKSQGGSQTGCGIPSNAIGIYLNVAAVEVEQSPGQ